MAKKKPKEKDPEEDFKQQEVKKLPRSENGSMLRYFEANGQKYKIRSASEGIPIKRWTAYEKLNLMFGYNATLNQLYSNQKKVGDMLNDILLKKDSSSFNVMDVVKHQDSMLEGLKETSKARFSKGFYLCTIFIVRADENINDWDAEFAEQKIEDWTSEGYDSADFFQLARIFSPQLLKIMLEETENGLKSLKSGMEEE
jgi:hypothetical protein